MIMNLSHNNNNSKIWELLYNMHNLYIKILCDKYSILSWTTIIYCKIYVISN